jgi:hypothetical protein
MQGALKRELKKWTKSFLEEHQRSPTAEDKQDVEDKFVLLNTV